MKDLREYVSDMSLLCGAERLQYTEGKAKGMDVVRMHNGKISLFLKADKCLDILQAEYRGMPMGFVSKNGPVAPTLLNTGAYAFANGFDGGFLFTCGLDNVGVPCEVSGKARVQHGSVSAIPAENVRITYGEGGESVTVEGDVKYTALFGSKLILHRSIRLKYLSDEIEICDVLENAGFTDDEYVLLYHFNAGYPLISQGARVSVPAEKTLPVDERAAKAMAESGVLEAPRPGKAEEVFCHFLPARPVEVRVEGERYAAAWRFDGAALPYLMQWKSMASGDYALGIEPSVSRLNQDKTFTPIAAGERKTYRITVTLNEK